MNKEEIFEVWAPTDSRWSRWAKAVLFAHMNGPVVEGTMTENSLDVSWAPRVHENTVVVLDLPGTEGVATSLALAAKGYRPVPLYNAVPGPTSPSVFTPMSASEDPFSPAAWPQKR